MPFHSYQHMKAKYDWFPEWHRNYHREYQRKLRASGSDKPNDIAYAWWRRNRADHVGETCKQNVYYQLIQNRTLLNYAKKR